MPRLTQICGSCQKVGESRHGGHEAWETQQAKDRTWQGLADGLKTQRCTVGKQRPGSLGTQAEQCSEEVYEPQALKCGQAEQGSLETPAGLQRQPGLTIWVPPPPPPFPHTHLGLQGIVHAGLTALQGAAISLQGSRRAAASTGASWHAQTLPPKPLPEIRAVAPNHLSRHRPLCRISTAILTDC